MKKLQDRINKAEVTDFDLGDKKPTIQNRLLIDNSIVVTPDMSLFDRIEILLQSKAEAQVIWAINNIPKLSLDKSESFIPQLLKIMSVENLFIEIYSIYSLIAVYRKSVTDSNLIKGNESRQLPPTYYYNKKLAGNVFNVVIDKAKDYPAEEYANLIEALIDKIQDSLLNEVLVPTLFGFLKMNNHYQHFAGDIFSKLPFEKTNINQEMFQQFYSSSATSYLPKIAQRAAISFGAQWFNMVLPQQLLTMANIRESIRPAAARIVLTNIIKCNYNINDKIIFMFVLTTFSWALNNDEICLLLLEAANELLSKKKDKFLQKYSDIIMKVISTNNIEISKKLPNLFASQPLLFQGHEHFFKTIFKKFQKNSSTDVKKEFLKSLPTFYTNYSNFSQSTKEVIKNSFVQFFNEQSSEYSEILISSSMYSSLNLSPQIISHLIPQFLKLSTSFIPRWRQFEQCMKTYSSLADEYFMRFSDQFKPIIINAMEKNTRPLSITCNLFLSKMVFLSKNAGIVNNIKWITANFAQSKSAAMRSFFINLSISLCYSTSLDIFSDYVWPSVLNLANDPCVSVLATLVKSLPKFRRIFHQQIPDQSFENQITSLFNQLHQTNDTYLLKVIEETEPKFAAAPKQIDDSKSMFSKSVLPSLAKSSGSFNCKVNQQLLDKVKPRASFGNQNFSSRQSVSIKTSKIKPLHKPASLNSSISLKH